MFEKPKDEEMSERRRETRLPIEVDVIIFNGKSFFRTKTVNLSASGCRLLNPIPSEFMKENFEIVLAGSGAKQSSLQMMRGTVVDNNGCGVKLQPILQTVHV